MKHAKLVDESKIDVVEDRDDGSQGERLSRESAKLIPGGTQLLSKRPERYVPQQWPMYFESAKGIRIRDVDGREFRDFGLMSVGACILGYADEDVDNAVRESIAKGVQCSLNAPEEIELARLLCELHPWASMVRYARSGGEAMTIAVRIARAHTTRSKILFCGYHGWHDWYMASNLGKEGLDGHLMPGLSALGVPKELEGTAFGFHYNQLDELDALTQAHGDDVAAIVMEPQRGAAPEPGFLEGVRAKATEIGAVLVFDEITTGFRTHLAGIHMLHNVEPDIAVFAKALGNGYAMAAVVGTTEVMDAAQSTFISSTNWTERLGLVAALATLKKLKDSNAHARINGVGQQVQTIWKEAASRHNLSIHISGLDCGPHMHFEEAIGNLPLMTLFGQEMLKRGFLAASLFNASFAHSDEDVAEYGRAVDEVFGILSEAKSEGSVERYLDGPVAQGGFYRFVP